MVERLITRCLEKEAQARFQSASDLAFALDALDDAGAAAMRRPPSITTPPPGASNSGIVIARGVTGTAETQISARTLSTRKPKTSWRPIAAVCGVIVLVAAAAWIGRATRRVLPTTSWPSRRDGGVVYRRITYNARGTWNARLEPGGTAVLYSITPNVKLAMLSDTPAGSRATTSMTSSR